MEDRNYADECGDHGGTNRDGDPCGRAAGWGTDFDSGKCRQHRGTSPDGKSHEGNGNAITHGATADPTNLYENLTGAQAEWVDAKVEAYCEPRGITEDEPGHALVRLGVMHLFQAMRAHGELAKDGQSRTKVVGVAEHGPVTDEVAHYLNDVASGHTRDYRMAMKDAGVLDDPESQKADAIDQLGDGATLVFADDT
ncbi:hypothetical protein [Halomarina rubra]|uniref:Uncharacterized protein n=1 Tax=Halomarina rubra TaxID=2071873 RepID=A0ABD6B3L1_9EURY|nr:hypothetical protein [Halomarina rubra]